jgi:hypothetical protein
VGQLDEVRRLHRHLDVGQRYPMKKDYCRHAEDAAPK